MPPSTIPLATPSATKDLAVRLAASVRGGDVLALEGELGAGKTTLVQHFARALGVDAQAVRSPTFSLLAVHHGHDARGLTLCHADLYRLRAGEELEGIGLLDWLGDESAVTAIEWPAVAAPWLSDLAVWRIAIVGTDGDRRASVSGPRPLAQ